MRILIAFLREITNYIWRSKILVSLSLLKPQRSNVFFFNTRLSPALCCFNWLMWYSIVVWVKSWRRDTTRILIAFLREMTISRNANVEQITCNRDRRGPAHWSSCQSRSPNPSARVTTFDKPAARYTFCARSDSRTDLLLWDSWPRFHGRLPSSWSSDDRRPRSISCSRDWDRSKARPRARRRQYWALYPSPTCRRITGTRRSACVRRTGPQWSIRS